MSTVAIVCRELVELVTDYLEDRLPSEQRLGFEEHIAICPGCTAYLDQMRLTIFVTGALRAEDLDAQAREAMLAVFREFRP
jgi:anti-sigma factor RsiW